VAAISAGGCSKPAATSPFSCGRAAQLAKTGLIVKSPLGDIERPAPPAILQQELRQPFDL
jgi:hypothetical protein